MSLAWVTLALAGAPWADSHEMVDALAWAGTEREVRLLLHDARAPRGRFAVSLNEAFRRHRPKHRPLVATEVELIEQDNRRLVHLREAIVYTHRSKTPIDTITLRVFGNGQHRFPGSARVLDLRVDGRLARHTLEDTLLTVELPARLRRGDRARIYVDLVEELAAFDPTQGLDGAERVTAEDVGSLGHTPQAVHMGGFLPLVPPIDAEGRFDRRPLPLNGEYAVFEPANVHAVLELPSEYVVATTGVTTATAASGDRQSVVAVAADVRDFVVAMGRDLDVQEVEVRGITVRVLSPSDEALMGRHLVRWATTALEALTDAYGPLSIRELDVVEAPLRIALGQEFPQVVLVDLHHKEGSYIRSDLHPWTVAHEVAHQWWSMEVGSDARDAPWLDEALASHGAALVAADLLGPHAVEQRYAQDIRDPHAVLRAQGAADLPADLAGEAYDIYQYSTIVYGRAALFVAAVRTHLGPDGFSAAMHDYLDAHRGGMATADDLMSAWRRHSDDPEGLEALYRTWIREVPPEALLP